MNPVLRVSYLGLQDYQPVWRAMSAFTDNRKDNDDDQLWILQHPPVFTQGQAGKPEHLLNPGIIPVVQTDRGGQITYHGPGQIIAYPLINLRRRKLSVRDMITLLEEAAIELLAGYGVTAWAKKAAPGVYLQLEGKEAKIASVGLRVRRACSFHGLSINIAMDLSPFKQINPCGYEDLAVTRLKDLPQVDTLDYRQVEESIVQLIGEKLGAPIIVEGDCGNTRDSDTGFLVDCARSVAVNASTAADTGHRTTVSSPNPESR